MNGNPAQDIVTKGNETMKLRGKKFRQFAGVLIVVAATGLCGLRISAAQTKTIKGEVVDLMCYLDHADCAQTCIKGGGPVGILTGNNELYLIIGEHKPLNDQLAPLAAKIITVKGKVVERDGMKMIENAEILK
jgi:hypothetical protein